MKKIILSIIILIFLVAGCEIFNLNDFITPDDVEFLACIQELNTPQKISDYMIENFTYKVHTLWNPDPYTLWKIQEGDCNDFVTFGIFVADYHGYETYMIKIFRPNSFIKHTIAVYVEDICYSITDVQNYYYGFDTFREIVDWDSDNFTFLDWRKYIVYDFWNDIVEEAYNN